jgi:hypothetical protein
MEFLVEAGAGSLPADEAALRGHFQAFAERFVTPARITFEQVLLGETDPAQALAALAGGADPAEMGQPSLLPPALEAAAAGAVDGMFGEGFFAAVAALAPGSWGGPIGSSFGRRLVRLVELRPAEVPAFESVRAQVEFDWRRKAAAELREAQFRAMKERYTIVLPGSTGSP